MPASLRKRDKYRYLDIVILAVISIIISFFIAKASFAWTNPTSSPPSGGPSSPVTVGTTIYFNGTTCPTGWTELTSARGRYIVGLPSSGTLAGTAGTALTNLENRNLGTHTHSASAVNSNHTHTLVSGGGIIKGTGSGYFSAGGDTVTVTVNALNLPAGTPAPYIQFLTCQKL